MVEFTYVMYTSIQNGFMLRIPAKHTADLTTFAMEKLAAQTTKP